MPSRLQLPRPHPGDVGAPAQPTVFRPPHTRGLRPGSVDAPPHCAAESLWRALTPPPVVTPALVSKRQGNVLIEIALSYRLFGENMVVLKNLSFNK